MRYIYESLAELYDSVAQFDSDHNYVTIHAAVNKSFYGRILPPVPRDCPTPLGVEGGGRELPPIQDLLK